MTSKGKAQAEVDAMVPQPGQGQAAGVRPRLHTCPTEAHTASLAFLPAPGALPAFLRPPTLSPLLYYA